jgi:hypothetical protein
VATASAVWDVREHADGIKTKKQVRTALEPHSRPTPLSRPASSMLRISRRSWLHLTGNTARKAPANSYRLMAVEKQPCSTCIDEAGTP